MVKASLDMFIAIAVIYALFQDIRNMPATQATTPPTPDSSTNATIQEPIPEMAGVVIKVTDNLRKPLTELLTK